MPPLARSTTSSVPPEFGPHRPTPMLTPRSGLHRIVATNPLYTSTAQIRDTDPVMRSQFLDLANPFYGPAEIAGDFLVSYRRGLFKQFDWRPQLNVRNAWGNADDSIAVTHIPNKTRWSLSSTLTF